MVKMWGIVVPAKEAGVAKVVKRFVRFKIGSQAMIDDILSFVEEYCVDETQDDYENLVVGVTFKVFLTTAKAAEGVLPLILKYGTPRDLVKPRQLAEADGIDLSCLPLSLGTYVHWLEFRSSRTALALRRRGIKVIRDLIRMPPEKIADLDATTLADVKARLEFYELWLHHGD